MKSRFIRNLVTGAVMIGMFVIVIALLLANLMQPVYAQCGGPITLNKWVQDTTTKSVPACFYTVDGSTDQYISIRMERDKRSPRLDPYLELRDSTYNPKLNNVVTVDDDSGGNGNSLIDNYRLESTDTYTIVAHSYNDETYGVYWIYVTLSQ